MGVTKNRYDFKAILKKGRECGYTFRIKNYMSGNLMGIRVWEQVDGNDVICSHSFDSKLQAHNYGCLQVMQRLIEKGICKEDDFKIG